jgi:prepilin-type N-terminal cleavage/methylation domain-containing protein
MNSRSQPIVRNKYSQGFTLVEMLVALAVVAIIAVAGISAYIFYINTVKDQRVLSDGQEMHRAIETDTVAAKAGLPTGGLTENLNSDSTCEQLITQVKVKLESQNKTNPFTNTFLVQDEVPLDSEILPRGSIYLSCAVPSAKINSPEFYLQTCICTESDCTLQLVSSTPTQLNKDSCYIFNPYE